MVLVETLDYTYVTGGVVPQNKKPWVCEKKVFSIDTAKMVLQEELKNHSESLRILEYQFGTPGEMEDRCAILQRDGSADLRKGECNLEEYSHLLYCDYESGTSADNADFWKNIWENRTSNAYYN